MCPLARSVSNCRCSPVNAGRFTTFNPAVPVTVRSVLIDPFEGNWLCTAGVDAIPAKVVEAS